MISVNYFTLKYQTILKEVQKVSADGFVLIRQFVFITHISSNLLKEMYFKKTNKRCSFAKKKIIWSLLLLLLLFFKLKLLATIAFVDSLLCRR
jgi:hypothetical protein